MATVKILDGPIMKQEAAYFGKRMTVLTVLGGSKTYLMDHALISITKLSDTGKAVIFDMKLRDASTVRAETDTKIFHELLKLPNGQTEEPFIVDVRTPQEQRKQSSAIAWVMLLTFGIVGFGLYSCVMSDPGKHIKGQSELVAEVQVHCKELVRKSLKSPKSADFPWASDVSVSPDGQVFTVASYVDATNSFGAEIRSNYLCQLRWNGGGYEGWIQEQLVLQ